MDGGDTLGTDAPLEIACRVTEAFLALDTERQRTPMRCLALGLIARAVGIKNAAAVAKLSGLTSSNAQQRIRERAKRLVEADCWQEVLPHVAHVRSAIDKLIEEAGGGAGSNDAAAVNTKLASLLRRVAALHELTPAFLHV